MSILGNVLIYDTETTIYKHQQKDEEGFYDLSDKNGSAFCLPQKLVMSGFKWLGMSPETYSGNLQGNNTQNYFNASTLIIGFDIKFDLHWARRIGVDISKVVVWDCQIAEFMLECQQNRDPSMNDACSKYGIPLKLDVVREEYGEKGIDTDSIPVDVLRKYLECDLDKTEKIFKEQLFQFKGMRL